MPLRKRVAAARFEETKTRVSGAVLDFAGRVRSAFYAYEADEQMLELRQTDRSSARCVLRYCARRLHDAGNISDLDFFREQSSIGSRQVSAQGRRKFPLRQSREELNILMGLWGAQTAMAKRRTPTRHSRATDARPKISNGLRWSAVLDLAQTQQRIIGRRRRVGINQVDRPAAGIQRRTVGRTKRWRLGGRTKTRVCDSLVRSRPGAVSGERQQSCGVLSRSITLWECAFERKPARVRDRLEGASDRAMYYRDILLPLHERIVNEAQLQYNAMQLGPFQLLRAREQQIETAVAYIEALRDYWLARADIGPDFERPIAKLRTTTASQSSRGTTGMSQSEGH